MDKLVFKYMSKGNDKHLVLHDLESTQRSYRLRTRPRDSTIVSQVKAKSDIPAGPKRNFAVLWLRLRRLFLIALYIVSGATAPSFPSPSLRSVVSHLLR